MTFPLAHQPQEAAMADERIAPDAETVRERLIGILRGDRHEHQGHRKMADAILADPVIAPLLAGSGAETWVAQTMKKAFDAAALPCIEDEDDPRLLIAFQIIVEVMGPPVDVQISAFVELAKRLGAQLPVAPPA